MTPCRFGCSDQGAVAVVSLTRGCVAFPEDREQALCWHHFVKSRPLGEMELKADLTPGWFTRWLEGWTK